MPDPAFEKSCTIGSSIGACRIVVEQSHSGFHSNSLLGCSLFDCSGLHDCSSLFCYGHLRFNAYTGSGNHDGVRQDRNSLFYQDAQKYYTLQYKKGLIMDGMYKYIRSPNYLGEILIYSSYALLSNVLNEIKCSYAQHWLPWVILFYVWGTVFATRIITKEKRMERQSMWRSIENSHPEWEEYKKRTNTILPIRFFLHFFEKSKSDCCVC